MSNTLTRRSYAAMYGPTTGDRIRLADTELILCVERDLTIYGDGSQTRSFCYVEDLIRGMIALAESGHHQPVNVGNPDEFKLLELAQIVIEVTGSKSEIVFEALPTDDPKVRQPDTRLAQEILDWHPEVGLREGLERTIEQAGVEVLLGSKSP